MSKAQHIKQRDESFPENDMSKANAQHIKQRDKSLAEANRQHVTFTSYHSFTRHWACTVLFVVSSQNCHIDIANAMVLTC